MTGAGVSPTDGRATPPAGLLASTRAALGRGPALVGRAGALRVEGARWFDASAFPTPREEAWRFTPLSPVLRVPYAPGPTDAAEPPPSSAGPEIVVVNGRVVRADVPEGVDAGTLAAPFSGLAELVEAHLGLVARLEDGFAAQNAALFEDVLVLRVRRDAQVEAPIVVVHALGGGETPLLSVPRVLVVAEARSRATLVQRHVPATGPVRAPALESSVTELVLAEGAQLEHVRVLEGTAASAAVSRVAARQGEDSAYVSRVFTLGGALSRLALDVTLEAPGATATLEGLYSARSGEVTDHHTTIDHASPRCTSHERYKGTLDGTGIAIFDGTVIVRRDAAKTEAHQENRNLLLSNDAVVHTKPHLRIDTDDVKCSHGATVGRLDPAQLFYLRSRGIDAELARSVLTYAFAREMLEGVSVATLREALEGRLAARLPGGAAARELA